MTIGGATHPLEHRERTTRDLVDSRVMIEDWRTDFNEDLPHSSLGNLTPLEFKRDLDRNLSTPRV